MGNFFLQRLLGELGGGFGQDCVCKACCQTSQGQHASEGGTLDKETSNHELEASKTWRKKDEAFEISIKFNINFN